MKKNPVEQKKSHLKNLGVGAAAIGGLFACSQADADIINSGAGNGFVLDGAPGFASGTSTLMATGLTTSCSTP